MNNLFTTQTTTDGLSLVWSRVHKILFRFVFVFLLLFVLIFNNGAYPYLYPLISLLNKGLHWLTPWLAKHLLHLPQPITIFTNGSGDTTYDYVTLLLVLSIAFFSSFIWSVADQKRGNYARLYYWLTVAVRYYLAFTLTTYGLVKVFQLQFPQPGYGRMLHTYGNSSPMGLAWTFYGFSRGYNLLIGLVELSAVTLLFRKTVAFGATIAVFTSLNIMAINYFFDVPVKIISTALVIMSLFLLYPNLLNLFHFYFKDEPVKLFVVRIAAFKRKWLRVTRVVLKVILVVYIVAGFIQTGMAYYKMNLPMNNLYGAYTAVTYAVAGQTLLPLLTDNRQWKSLSIEKSGYGQIILMNDKRRNFSLKQHATNKMIVLSLEDSNTTDTLYYGKPSADQLLLNGKFEGNQVEVSLKRQQFDLTSRGFHWINEYPDSH